jgi:hypothetical protein
MCAHQHLSIYCCAIHQVRLGYRCYETAFLELLPVLMLGIKVGHQFKPNLKLFH